ncbi:hypothetical protein ATW62_06490 [Oenococcus oeni]|nr:hypothetical protein ATW62_06490 [Oenococcus oeni]
MVKDAESNEEADKKKKEEVDLHNQVDQLIFSSEKTLSDVGDKLGDSDKKPVQDALDELKKAKDSNNIETLKEKKDALEKAAQALAVKLYQQAGPQSGAAGQTDKAGQAGPNSDGKTGDDGKTVDGDFKEVNPDDKK